MRYMFIGLMFALQIGNVLAVAEDQAVLVDGPEVDLTLGDLRKTLLSVPKDVRAVMLTDKQGLRDAVNSTYLTKVAAYRALRRGLDKNKEIEARIWNRKQNILADAELQRVINEKLAGNADFESVAYEEYLANLDQYQKDEEVEAEHVLLKFAEGVDEALLLSKANDIRKQIISGQLSFEEAAKKYSEDPGSAERGGTLGRFSRGRMVKPFEDAVFSLKPGEISEPVKTRFGYHLIKVTKIYPAGTVPFDKVKQQLVEKIKKKTEARLRRDYWLELEGDPAIKPNKALIDEFVKNPDLGLAPQGGN